MQALKEQMKILGFKPYFRNRIVLKVSEKTNLPPFIIVALNIAILIILSFTRIGPFLTKFLTFFSPAYYTYKALESEGTDDDKEMLTFWICYGFIYILDKIFVEVFGVFEFYHLVRTVLIEVIYLKDFAGANYIYENFIKPFFYKYSPYINKVLEPFEHRGTIATE